MLTNQYANYFCPKLFGALDFEDRLKFLHCIRPYCVVISRSKVGTYPLQIIIETIKTKEESLVITDAFKNDILDVCYVIHYINCLYRTLKVCMRLKR
jgi:hypothetical protein